MIHCSFIICILASALSTTSCPAHASSTARETDKPRVSFTEEEQGREISHAIAKEVKAHSFVEIEFPKSSAHLTMEATSSLNSAIQKAKQKGRIVRIIAISWSNEEYPSEMRVTLSTQQSVLAESRNAIIKDYFGSSGSTASIDTYNMAERPNTFSKWFNTSDSRFKELLIFAGLPTTSDQLQYPSNAAHSIIFFKVR